MDWVMGFEPMTLATAELNISPFYPKNTVIEMELQC
jgi:hypothetical protein